MTDPTGAGDAFAGGFIGALAEAGSTDPATLRKAVICGSSAASVCVEHMGIDGIAKLDGETLQRRKDQFVDLVRF